MNNGLPSTQGTGDGMSSLAWKKLIFFDFQLHLPPLYLHLPEHILVDLGRLESTLTNRLIELTINTLENSENSLGVHPWHRNSNTQNAAENELYSTRKLMLAHAIVISGDGLFPHCILGNFKSFRGKI